MPAFPDLSLSSARAEVQPGVWLDARRVLWLERERILVVADLHWGYAASHRARGHLVPWWGDDEIEAALESLLADHPVAEMLWLGDIVHAAEGGARVEAYLRHTAVPVTILAGNHDRRWPGATATTARRGPWFFHHGDAAHPVPAGCTEVIGHHHPALSWSDGAGGNLKVPALVASPRRLILPAFSPWATGTPCGGLLDPDAIAWAVTPRRVFPVSSPDRVFA